MESVIKKKGRLHCSVVFVYRKKRGFRRFRRGKNLEKKIWGNSEEKMGKKLKIKIVRKLKMMKI